MTPVPLPPQVRPPYWQPITEQAYHAAIGAPLVPGCLDLAPGWQLAAFSQVEEDLRRETLPGWVKGAFAIADLPVREGVMLGDLTHLPTGYRIGLFVTAEQAAEAGDIIADLAAWSAPDLGDVETLGLRAAEVLRAAGFRAYQPVIPEVQDVIWKRAPGGLN